MAVNYYDTLGVRENATHKEIGDAFNLMLQRFEAEKIEALRTRRLAEIQEAYDVLSNRDTREIYDKYGADVLQSPDYRPSSAPAQMQSGENAYDAYRRLNERKRFIGRQPHSTEYRDQFSLDTLAKYNQFTNPAFGSGDGFQPPTHGSKFVSDYSRAYRKPPSDWLRSSSYKDIHTSLSEDRLGGKGKQSNRPYQESNSQNSYVPNYWNTTYYDDYCRRFKQGKNFLPPNFDKKMLSPFIYGPGTAQFLTTYNKDYGRPLGDMDVEKQQGTKCVYGSPGNLETYYNAPPQPNKKETSTPLCDSGRAQHPSSLPSNSGDQKNINEAIDIVGRNYMQFLSTYHKDYCKNAWKVYGAENMDRH